MSAFDHPPALHSSAKTEQTAQAFWFGDADTPLLGWYHPAQSALRRCGVVLCPPFGHEYMVSYLSYKHFAMQLADAGFPVCFFDYDGCGDSAESDTARIETWQQNICQAAEQLRRLSGVEQVSVFGTRMGALLAASVARKLASPAILMLAPVISGRSYVRELLALRGMSSTNKLHQNTDPDQGLTEDELTGYAFKADTRAGLSQLDLLKIPAPQAAVMIAARDDISGQEAKLAHAWRHDDHSTHLITTPGYAAMMTEDAHESSVPHSIWVEMCQWLMQQIPVSTTSSEKATACPKMPPESVISDRHLLLTKHCRLRHDEQILHEETVCFDDMVGVISRPSDDPNSNHESKRAIRPAIILTNIGANHRVGNHRLYVRLARTLAAQGFTVLRFDKRGIGYSQPTPEGRENDVHGMQGVEDIRSAMQWIEQSYGHSQFILAGLCSGAYLSYLAAINDSRVVGLVLMNQLTFYWRTTDVIQTKKASSFKSTQFYLRAVGHSSTWRRIIRGKIASRRILKNLAKKLLQKLVAQLRYHIARFMKSHHLLGRVARNFRTMQARGTELIFVFDANDSSIDLMNKHLGSHAQVLENREQIKILVLNDVDHTFTPLWSQTYLSNMLARHLAERFPEQSATAVSKL